MIRELRDVAVVAALLLSTASGANAGAIIQQQSVAIQSASDGPVLFDFGTVTAGVSNTFTERLVIYFFNSGGSALTIPAPTGGSLANCPSMLSSGANCTEVIGPVFTETAATAAGIYSGHIIQTFSFVNAAGVSISDPVEIDWKVNVGGVAVPGPILGAGLPGLVAACGGLLAWRRRRLAAA